MRMPLLIILLFALGGSWARPGDSRVQTKAPAPDSPAPRGWVLFPKPSKDSAALRCANYSTREWRVSLSGEQLQIRLAEDRDLQDDLPAVIPLKNVASSPGDRHVISVSDGWLVGVDAGEFGGGIWWFSTDGLRNKKLSNENVHGFVNTSQGTLALVGLAHLGFDFGKVLRIVNEDPVNKRTEILTDLDSAPATFVAESPDSTIILTSMGLVRLKTSGSVEQLLKTNYESLFPTSMTLSSSGVIHVGMRHFVTRLTPTGNTYREQWFVPANCARFAMRNHDCVCNPGHR